MEWSALITTVCLNPSIDHMLVIDGFAYGGLNRVRDSRYDAGGKGLNVAVTVSALGAEAECAGFMFKESARLFETRLRMSGTASDFVWLEGSARTNLKVFDRERGVVTEFNESGRQVGRADLERMTELVEHRAARADFLVLSGSLPPGCPVDYYAQLMRAVAGEGCRCVLDADGAPLREGLKERAWMLKPNRAELEALTGRTLCDIPAVKPNRAELEALTGRKLESVQQVRDAARELIAGGATVVAVSLGGDGAVIADAREAFFAPPLKIEVRSTVGAGDAMVAALTSGFAAGKGLEEAFRMGVANASAMCMTQGSEPPAREDFEALLQTVQTERI